MKLALLSAIFLFSLKTIACGMHPGMSHEEWTSAVKDERTKTGAVVTVSDGFFNSKPLSNNPGAEDRGKRGSGRRPEAER